MNFCKIRYIVLSVILFISLGNLFAAEREVNNRPTEGTQTQIENKNTGHSVSPDLKKKVKKLKSRKIVKLKKRINKLFGKLKKLHDPLLEILWKVYKFPLIITIIFVSLKLLGLIFWSWLWILSPLWIMTILLLLALLLIIMAFRNW